MHDFRQFEEWLDRLPTLPADATEAQYRAFQAEMQRWQVSSTMVMAAALQDNTNESKLTRELYRRVLDVLDPQSRTGDPPPPPPPADIGAHMAGASESDTAQGDAPQAPASTASPTPPSLTRTESVVQVLQACADLVRAVPMPAWVFASIALLAAVLGAYGLSYTDEAGRRIGVVADANAGMEADADVGARNTNAPGDTGGGGGVVRPGLTR